MNSPLCCIPNRHQKLILNLKNIFFRRNLILIHGTFAKQASRIMPCARWWKEKQPFYEMLKKSSMCKKKVYLIILTSFAWSGSLQHDKRVEAGSQLAQYY